MNTTLVNKQPLWRTALIDVALLATACLVPTISHLTALPLYHLNPMMLVLMASLLLVNDRRNAYLMALLLPCVSMLAVGMPTPLKALCMVAEMETLVLVSQVLKVFGSKFFGQLGAMLVAMLCGKVVYYSLKALLIPAVALVGTPVATQVIVCVAAAIVFALIVSRKN